MPPSPVQITITPPPAQQAQQQAQQQITISTQQQQIISENSKQDLGNARVYLSFAEFRKSDENPRKFRHYMMLMQRGEGKMRKEGRIQLLGKEQIRGKRERETPKVRSKEFGSVVSSKMHKLKYIKGMKSADKKKTRGVLFHLLRLAIYDRNAVLAASIIKDLSGKAFVRKKPLEANMCLLLAMANRMESTCIAIMAKGFPWDVNAPIFATAKTVAKGVSPLYPSYFLSAVALGLDTLVRFMIKRRAHLNQSWFGLTPLLVAVYTTLPTTEKMIKLLLDHGATTSHQIMLEQYRDLVRLKMLFPTNTASIGRGRPYLPQPQLEPAPSLKLTRDKFLANLDSLISVLPKSGSRSSLTWSGPATDKETRKGLDVLGVDGGWWESIPEEYKREKKLLVIDAAAAVCNVEGIDLLLRKASDRNIVAQSNLCLMVNQSLEVIIPLLMAGANLYQKEHNGGYPIHLASRMGALEAVAVLLHFDTLRSGGRSTLTLQKDRTVTDRIELRINSSFEFPRNEDMNVNAKSYINIRGQNGFTPLHEACATSQWDVVGYLLRHGADINVENDAGDTPLQLAIKIAPTSTNNSPASIKTIKARFKPSLSGKLNIQQNLAEVLLEGSSTATNDSVFSLGVLSAFRKERSQSANQPSDIVTNASLNSGMGMALASLREFGGSPRLGPIGALFSGSNPKSPDNRSTSRERGSSTEDVNSGGESIPDDSFGAKFRRRRSTGSPNNLGEEPPSPSRKILPSFIETARSKRRESKNKKAIAPTRSASVPNALLPLQVNTKHSRGNSNTVTQLRRGSAESSPTPNTSSGYFSGAKRGVRNFIQHLWRNTSANSSANEINKLERTISEPAQQISSVTREAITPTSLMDPVLPFDRMHITPPHNIDAMEGDELEAGAEGDIEEDTDGDNDIDNENENED